MPQSNNTIFFLSHTLLITSKYEPQEKVLTDRSRKQSWGKVGTASRNNIASIFMCCTLNVVCVRTSWSKLGTNLCSVDCCCRNIACVPLDRVVKYAFSLGDTLFSLCEPATSFLLHEFSICL